jgi:two-component system nitrate/nitrite response regulator NarL
VPIAGPEVGLVDNESTYLEQPLRVIVSDEDPLARRAVRDALQQNGIVVIAEAGGCGEALELALHYAPDLVVLEIAMRPDDGIAVTERLVQRGIGVLILSSREDDELALRCLRSGAIGYVPKTIGTERLPLALRVAQSGEPVITRRLTLELIRGLRRQPDEGLGLRPVTSALTSREWEVLDLLCRQLSTEQIAERLVLSPETVRSHLKNVFRKLGVRSREDAVRRARELRTQPSGEGPGLTLFPPQTGRRPDSAAQDDGVQRWEPGEVAAQS